MLECAIVSTVWLVIVGDFNFHMEDTSRADVQKFLEILESFGLSQRVNGATHQKGHTLDLVITRDSEKCYSNAPGVLLRAFSLVDCRCDGSKRTKNLLVCSSSFGVSRAWL